MGEYYKDPHRYDDIIDLPHHQSAERPHMSLRDRAAQFAPFEALNGHEEAVEEAVHAAERKFGSPSEDGALRETWEESAGVDPAG